MKGNKEGLELNEFVDVILSINISMPSECSKPLTKVYEFSV